jgi:hypothetical protein
MDAGAGNDAVSQSRRAGRVRRGQRGTGSECLARAGRTARLSIESADADQYKGRRWRFLLDVVECDRHALHPLDGPEQRQPFDGLMLVRHLPHQDKRPRFSGVCQVQGRYFRIADRHDGTLMQGDIPAAMLR